jgi:HEPN domain-containing protein
MQPNPPTAWLTRQWLIRARRDLWAADHDATAVPTLRDSVAYHAQQAAEKALKAFLVWHGHPVRRTHSLPHLVGQCEVIDPNFSSLAVAAAVLNPYVNEFRYPGSAEEPSEAAANDARRLARQVMEFVLARLPSSAHP